MNQNIELTRIITKYLQGQLSEDEAVDLWFRLLQYPEWIFYLQVEIAINEMHCSKLITHRLER